jgi:hypothetical protein
MLGSEFETYGKNLEQTLQAGDISSHPDFVLEKLTKIKTVFIQMLSLLNL